jgi:CDP-4-dehydro-6-deoxyglucose reductase
MSQLLTLSRAARLVGVSRGMLQHKIQDGELSSFDGMVSADELLRLFPGAKLENEPGFERITRIKEEAFGKRVRERTLPSQEILAERLFEQSRELADLRAHLQHYHALVVRARERVRELEDDAAPALRQPLSELGEFLDSQLSSVLGDSEAPNALAVMDDMLRVMAAHVVIHPSRHEFFVNGADTLLEAALHAGLAINYGCSSGNCGLCKARVVSGQVKKMRPHDYVLSEAEKQQGYTLLCAHTAITDLVIEALEATQPTDIPQQQIGTRVKTVESLSDDVMLLHLQTPRSNRLRFLAGQNVTLSAAGAEPMTLPVASCPCDDRNLHFHVERSADNTFAELVRSGLQPGDAVTIWGPSGDFTLRADSSRSHVFIAVDAGFAPVKSLIEHAMALDTAEEMHLYWLATRPGGHYLAKLCRAWANALDNFHYVPVSGESGDAIAQLADRLVAAHTDLGRFDVYLAGPAACVEALAAFLDLQQFPRSQLTVTAI